MITNNGKDVSPILPLDQLVNYEAMIYKYDKNIEYRSRILMLKTLMLLQVYTFELSGRVRNNSGLITHVDVSRR